MLGGLIRGLATSARYGRALLAVAILVGVLVPALAHALRGAVPITVVALSTLVILRVDVPATLRHLRRPVRVMAVLTVQMLVCPMLAWGLLHSLPLDPALADAVVLFATGPALVSAPAFARLLGTDPELALLGALFGTLLVPVSAPPIAWALTGIDLAISPLAFSARLAIVVGLPVLISAVGRRMLGPLRLESMSPTLDGVVVWVLVGLGLGLMDGVGLRFTTDTRWVLGVIGLAFAAVLLFNVVTTILLFPLGLDVAATAGMLSGFRSMALYLAVLPVTADPRLALFFGLYQIPLYVAPVLMAPIYRRLLRSGGGQNEAARPIRSCPEVKRLRGGGEHADHVPSGES